MRRFFTLLALLTLWVVPAHADETIVYPDISPEISVTGGWRSVDASRHPAEATEYEDLKSYAQTSGDILLFPFPHRLHFEFDLEGQHDYFSDLSYAYQDVLLLRWVQRSLHHNMGRIDLVDLDPADSAVGVDVRDKGKQYSVNFAYNTVSARIKPIDFPLHFFIDGTFIHKDGDIQQRFKNGSADTVRASESRHIDWQTNIVDYGSNVHMGPVEVEVSHEDKTFKSDGQTVMTEHYEAGKTRAEGDYPHNLIPDLTGHTDTLKLHTSYTGIFAASGTVSRTERYNEQSGTEEQRTQGGASVFLRPTEGLTFTFKYHHTESRVDNPDTLKSGYLGYASYTEDITGIKDTMDVSNDEYTLSARLRQWRWLTLGAEYMLKATHRVDAEQWGLPSLSSKQTETLLAWGTLPWHLKWKASYGHSEMQDPAYNTDADKSNQGKLSLVWTPSQWFMADLSYQSSRGKRDNLEFGSGVEAEADNRLLKHQQLTVTLTVPVSERLCVGAGYSLYLDKVRQDMVYGSDTADANVRYTDQANTYFGSLTYRPTERLTLGGSVNYTVAISHYLPSDELITSYSEVSSRQTTYKTTAAYEFTHGWHASVELEYSVYDDLVQDNDNPTVSDGNVTDITFKLTKKW